MGKEVAEMEAVARIHTHPHVALGDVKTLTLIGSPLAESLTDLEAHLEKEVSVDNHHQDLIETMTVAQKVSLIETIRGAEVLGVEIQIGNEIQDEWDLLGKQKMRIGIGMDLSLQIQKEKEV